MQKKVYTEEKAKVVPVVWGTEFILLFAELQIQRQDASEKWMIFQFTVHTTPSHPKMDVLPKTFLQIVLAAKQ